MIWRSAAILALAVLTTAPLDAVGGQSRKWWQAEEVREEIGLTDSQSARIEEIFQETLPTLRAQKQELDRLEDTLSALLRAEGTSEAEVSRQIDEVEAARSALSKSRTLMLFRMHRILSTEQRAELRRLHERRDRRRHDHERP